VFFTYFDASALGKRFAPELGTPVVDHLFCRVPTTRFVLLSVGLAEVASNLVRKRNGHRLSPATCAQAIIALRAEVGLLSPVRIVDADANLANQSFDLIDRYSVNSTDAILLRSALNLAVALRGAGDDLLLVSCDARLLKAAAAEGLTTFDPETQSTADLDALLGP
jgi:predicted nucleic acid-binding protein